ncbi:unnamed protein product [Rhizophagus irregularis]|uniref:MATA-HMG n=2 Tax=Rhizophagus irregularis TaxID=588596 RepID=A0A1B1EWF5_9GLOM|nr:MATA-HMG [Rhizophagus irregularis]PKY47654.1 hypothetical protein RhiirA4_544110 [Rhizophagus irregularis]CAB4426398.1 unnamed protein product [Rhizophagus irregularis]
MTKKTSKRSSDTKIRNMRQGQVKIKLDLKKPSPSSPPLPLPFPPTQRVEQIVAKLVAKPRLARFPNAFIMYRNEYVQYLKSQGYHISMTELSPMISTSWKKESEFVKEAYTKLSSEAEKMYVRDTGSTQQQINYKYLPTRPTLSSKSESNGNGPKLDDLSGQSNQSNQSHQFQNPDDFYNINNIYDRLFQYSIPPNGFQRNYSNKEPEQIPSFSIGTSGLEKYSLDNVTLPQPGSIPSIPQQDYFPDNIFQCQWSPNIPSSIQHNNPSVSFGPSYSPTSPTFDDLINSPIMGFASLEAQMLESMSPSSNSSIDDISSSIDDISLLFSPEIDDGGFYEKSDFSTPNFTDSITCQSPLSSPSGLYLYPGQSFATNPSFQS